MPGKANFTGGPKDRAQLYGTASLVRELNTPGGAMSTVFGLHKTAEFL